MPLENWIMMNIMSTVLMLVIICPFVIKKISPKIGCLNGNLGLNQGPIILMIENYKSGLIWDIIKKSPHIIDGLKKAGFSGGWLDQITTKN
jgi:hypothetical protein